MSILIIVSQCLLDYSSALLPKSLGDSSLALLLQFICLRLNKRYSLVFELTASEASDHDALVRQIQLFLRTDLFPSVAHEERQTVHWHILALIGPREQGIFLGDIEAASKFFAFLEELLFFENFVRKHAELKVEKIAGFRTAELLRLINIVPDVCHIGVYDVLNPLKVVSSVVEVSQNEE